MYVCRNNGGSMAVANFRASQFSILNDKTPLDKVAMVTAADLGKYIIYGIRYTVYGIQ